MEVLCGNDIFSLIDGIGNKLAIVADKTPPRDKYWLREKSGLTNAATITVYMIKTWTQNLIWAQPYYSIANYRSTAGKTSVTHELNFCG
jgi:hypothetical protein